ncbi:MAG: thiamine phosphate synthase [Thermomicrobiales bacterium]|jgi:thiamine-phosphate pyrophosphorylase|nr:thiamine phosphate synthase [Thermomicrobiales bacterium]
MAEETGAHELAAAPSQPAPRLHLVTDRRLCGERPLVDVVAEAARGGLGAVQLREKDLSGGPLLAEALALKRVLGATLLVVNERADVAAAAGAAGVHLPGDGLPVDVARRLLGPDALIGRSAHSVAEAQAAEQAGADYVILGTIFATASKPGREPAGLALVEATAQAVRLPVIAIGGIDEQNVAAVIGAGAWGVAVMSAILRAPAPAVAAERLQAIVGRETAWR